MDLTLASVHIEIRRQLARVFDLRELQQIECLLLEQFGISRVQAIAYPDTKISQTDYDMLLGQLKRLAANEPVQYVLGETEFMGLTFRVTPDVLIPRPETADLVRLVCDKCGVDAPTIIDIGTGSGCIAITLKKLMTNAEVTALDVSEAALVTAQYNAALNNADVRFICHDVLTDDIPMSEASVDVVVSNPPYVTESDKEQMSANVLDYEPHTALFVPDENPLLFYKRIAELSKKWLKPGGRLFFEINERLGVEMLQLLVDMGYADVEVHKDFNEKDRMVSAVWNVK